MMNLLDQIKKLRIKLGFKQHDMYDRIGMSRQQYQRLESKGNPRLKTLNMVALALNADLMLVPRNKVPAVLAVLGQPDTFGSDEDPEYDPWRDFFGDEE